MQWFARCPAQATRFLSKKDTIRAKEILDEFCCVSWSEDARAHLAAIDRDGNGCATPAANDKDCATPAANDKDCASQDRATSSRANVDARKSDFNCLVLLGQFVICAPPCEALNIWDDKFDFKNLARAASGKGGVKLGANGDADSWGSLMNHAYLCVCSCSFAIAICLCLLPPMSGLDNDNVG